MEPGALLAHGMLVPSLGMTAFNCEPWASRAGDPDILSPSGYATAIGRGSCVVPNAGDPLAHYAVYATREALAAEYDAIMNDQGIPAGGACTTTIPALPANATWNLPGLPASGSLGCFARSDGVQYVWTDNRRRMLGQWYTFDYNEGHAFWEAWSTGLDGFEQLLGENTSGDHTDPCVRAPEPDFAEALAVLACPLAGSENPMFYVQYYVPWLVLDGPDPPGDPFPNDPMTRKFLSLLAEGGVDVDTTEGCYEGASGRYMWGYLNPGFSKDTGAVSDPGKAMGYVGCYTRTEGANTTTRLVFTSNISAVLILWDAPDIERAMAFVQGWIRQGQIQ